MDRKITINDFTEKLQGPRRKITPQRKTVLQVFIDNPSEHLSAENVHYLLHNQGYDIGLATVYRTLELLVDLTILQKIEFGDGCRRYELNNNDPTRHQHHHLICLSCGKVSEFVDDLLDDLEANILKENGFRVTNHQVNFYGYCKDCQEKHKDMPIAKQLNLRKK